MSELQGWTARRGGEDVPAVDGSADLARGARMGRTARPSTHVVCVGVDFGALMDGCTLSFSAASRKLRFSRNRARGKGVQEGAERSSLWEPECGSVGGTAARYGFSLR